jgi:hypothetical protein
MNVGRHILTMIIAVALAVLPAFGGAVSVAKSVETALTAPVEECCEHGATHGTPCENTAKMPQDCSLACCAISYVYPGTAGWDIVYVPVARTLDPIHDSDAVISRATSPPFRPPRA